MKPETLFEHTYLNGIRVVVTTHGVSIVDSHAGRWVVDASIIAKDTKFYVSRWIKKFETNSFQHLEFESLYSKSSS